MANPMYGQNKMDSKLDDHLSGKKQVFRFGNLPVCVDGQHTVDQLIDGTAADKVIHQYTDGLELTSCAIGTQTLDKPARATTGVDYGFDQTNDEGVNWVMSDEASKGREGIDRFTVGKQAFSAELEFSIGTVAGTDDCCFGFRKVEAVQADINGYDELASLNAQSGNIFIESIINAATNVSEDTTANWADGESHALKVMVSKAGLVTYEIDGATPSTVNAVAFSFDAGEVVTPFFYLIHASGAQAGLVIMRKLTVESDNGSMED